MKFAWEMAQMYAYRGSGGAVPRMFLFCMLATRGAAIYTVPCCWLGAALTADENWIFHITWTRVTTSAIWGPLTSVTVERTALALGVWRYSNRMVQLPAFGVGLWPVVQLMLLPIVTFWLVRLIERHSGNPG